MDYNDDDLHLTCDSFDVEYEDRVSFDDSMDGDAGTALASAGWGTDEDYGYFDCDD
jgi:hypothetical protein